VREEKEERKIRAGITDALPLCCWMISPASIDALPLDYAFTLSLRQKSTDRRDRYGAGAIKARPFTMQSFDGTIQDDRPNQHLSIVHAEVFVIEQAAAAAAAAAAGGGTKRRPEARKL
jgi:hypothetical protein